MKKTILVFLGVAVFLPLTAFADIAIPTETRVYFKQNNEPYNKSVNFSVDCYGYSWNPGPEHAKKPGTYTPEKVFTFSASCPEYGCKIYPSYYLNYRHIDYCTLTGKSDDKNFTIEKYGAEPVDFSTCTDLQQIDESGCDKNGCHMKKDGKLIDERTLEKDDQGNALERRCKLEFSVPFSEQTDSPASAGRGWWGELWCWIKSLFGKEC